MSEILIPILTPLLIAVVKMGAQALERVIPVALLPALAPVLGVVVNLVMGLLGMETIPTETAATLGLAGVGVREIAVKGTRTLASGGTT
ncbi:MAG: hypothetical protein ACYSWU_17975 [Planctomycetota bacterium]|jgi:hypothetical protein